MEYITHIDILRQRNIPQCSIDLSKDRRQHLIITGPNGCGKTTFVNELYKCLTTQTSYNIREIAKEFQDDECKSFNEISKKLSQIGTRFNKQLLYSSIERKISQSIISCDIATTPGFYIARELGNFIIYDSVAHRKGIFQTPQGPKRLPAKATGDQFVQMLVNLRTQQSYLFEDMSKGVSSLESKELRIQYEELVKWFDNLFEALSELLGTRLFELQFDRVKYNYSIKEQGKEPYDFSQLSDGYSAILKVVSDLMLAMSTGSTLAYTTPGIAIIDEIETHLHVELQRKILPFLVKFFPNIQFIVTTHSPFILSSIDNAVIFDMKSLKSYTDLSQYSYSNLIEGYFNTSLYSGVCLEDLEKACSLLASGNLSENDRKFILEFDHKLNQSSQLDPMELKFAWLQTKLKNLAAFNDLSK